MSITLTGTAAINYLQADNAKLQADNAKLQADNAKLTAKVSEQHQWQNTILNEGEEHNVLFWRDHEAIWNMEGIAKMKALDDYIGEMEDICYQGVDYCIQDGNVYNDDLEAIGNWDSSTITFLSQEAQDAHESHESYEGPEQAD
jgi:hypothetical protein